MKLLTAFLLIVVLVMIVKTYLFSFRAQSPDDYSETGPQFDLKTHLSGEILAEGLIYGPTGKMTNSFVARMVGEWDGDVGTLTEDFIYSNGKTQSRKWFLTLGPDNTFTAEADDLRGTGYGTVSGSTVQLHYEIILPEDAGGHVLKATDWMYLTQDGAIMNKSEMRKFGLKVAELVATMRQVDQPDE